MTVNSHNEWDPLTEVIVGKGIPESLPALDFTFKLFFHDNIYGKSIGEPGREYITKKVIEEHNEDLEDFARLLQNMSIKVRRPDTIDKIRHVSTPDWKSTNSNSLNCRDMAIVIGDTIIETPPTCRWRYFENDLLKRLFLEYFKSGAKWVAAPKPLMLDGSYDVEFFKESSPEIYTDYISQINHDVRNIGYEIMFDAANCMRLGTHILMNVSNDNQRMGAQWLRSILGDRYTIWEASICDNHIDSEFIPLRPGLAIITVNDIIDKLPEEIKKWDMIYVPEVREPLNRYKCDKSVSLSSPKIDYNILSISPDIIISNQRCSDILRKHLKKYKIEVIESPMRHAEIFAGGHHCVTLDIHRTGKLECYF